MALGLLFYLLGYLEVRVAGARPERFLNLAVANGIYFWDVRWRDGELHLKMGIEAFRRIRPIVHRSRCRVRILRRRGFPFAWRRAAGRRVLLAGGLVLLACFYLLSGFVWFIEVRGLKEVPEEAVLTALARLGLRPGAWKGRIDPDRVGEELPAIIPRLGWAGVYFQGTKAVVEVAERTVLPADRRPEEAPGDIVAAKDGLITHFLVLRGEGLVREGQTVRRGQILVRGMVGPAEGDVPPGDRVSPPLLVRARGVVRARVWYDAYAEVPLRMETPVRTGDAYVRRIVKILGKPVVVSGWRRVPFDDYQVEETIVRPREWRNIAIPVEFKLLRYHKVIRRVDDITQSEAVRRAQVEARRRILEEVPVSAHILKESAQVVQLDRRLVGVRVMLETEEDIGRFRPAGAGAQGRVTEHLGRRRP